MADSFQKRQLERPAALLVLVALLSVTVSPSFGNKSTTSVHSSGNFSNLSDRVMHASIVTTGYL
ncbi:orf1ab polyprotein (pp1ab) [Anopheles sinensis]|uniref:Orf1ab polyprotein (Pp1ab) n=1 Tax=Anopheles sinensis TaxID=74873 RepID=A0A084WTI8_ANOSI|nr:orf1ab polyprotein (pp1ab) [Anopheles sinensis]